MAGPESRIRTSIVKALRGAGYWTRVQHASAVTGRGASDLITAPWGRLILLEVKTPTGTVKSWQQEHLDDARTHGIPAYVVTSVAEAQACVLLGLNYYRRKEIQERVQNIRGLGPELLRRRSDAPRGAGG